MVLICGDFETHWSTDYSLTKMNTTEYIMDSRFEAIMLSLKVGNSKTRVFVGPNKIAKALSVLDWSQVAWLSHNVAFDGAVLAWRFGYTPKLYLDTLSMCRATTHWTIGRSSLAKVAEYLGLPAKGDEVIRAKGKRLIDFTDAELEDYKRYCVRDTDLCHAIFTKLKPHFRASELSLIDMIARMFITPQVKLNPVVLQQNYERVLQAKKEALLKVVDIPKPVFSSNPQFAALLESYGVEVPMKISPTTGNMIPALAKGDWAFKELCADETQPMEVQALLAARQSVKSTLEETRSLMMLGLSKRGEGWAPIPLKFYGARCLPGTAEVLTLNGWVALQNWQGGDIAQVHPNQTIEFAAADRFVGHSTDEWVDVSAPYINCQFTAGHTVPFLHHGSFAWDTMQAAALLDRSSAYIPTGGLLIHDGRITANQMRVLVMVQADGHWQLSPGQGRELRLKLKRPRKINRARMLLSAVGISYREGVYPSQPDYVSFRIAGKDWPDWLTIERKKFGSWLLDSTTDALLAFTEELVHWDGCASNNQVVYNTTDYVNADWVMTIAHLTDYSATLSTRPAARGRLPLHRVALRRRAHAMVFKKHVTVDSSFRIPYCATTQTGFFLVRHEGHIFVTGNTGRLSGDGGSNWQNLTRGSLLKTAIEAPAGYRIVHRDASQIEARMVAWMAQCWSLLEAFAQKRDVYSEFARIIYGKDSTNDISKLERFVGKTAILGLGYGCGAEKFRKMLFIGNGGISLKVEIDEAETIVTYYRSIYPEIPDLWGFAKRLLNQIVRFTNGVAYAEPAQDCNFGHIPVKPDYDCLVLPNGMRICYPELRTTKDMQMQYTDPTRNYPIRMYGAKCIENISQALSRIIVTDIALRMLKTGYRPFLTTHDSLDYCVPQSEASSVDAELARQFAHVPAWAHGLPLASEGGWGKNLTAAERGAND